VLVTTSRAGLLHPGMPEQPARLAAVLRALESDPRFLPRDASPAPLHALARVHPLRWLERIQAAAEGSLDPGEECGLLPESWPAILGGSGAVIAAVDAALDADRCAFAAIRPPGHHASAEWAMGFCPVNQVVIGLAHARARGVTRVLLVDWDVHHGNGTQELVVRDAETRFVSMHQHPWYPGTGLETERGIGNLTNVPLPPGLPRATYLEALWGAVVAATSGWSPELVLVSAGFDSLAGDPLGGFTLEPEDYATWIRRFRERWPVVPIVGVMEGGYAPERLAAGVMATVGAMLD
jgi:acetoin utilization deacetylase AcuC-like enzyme